MTTWNLNDEDPDHREGGTAPEFDADGESSHDDGRLPEQARRAYIALLNSRYISRAKNRTAWEGLVAWEHELRARLDELYLDLVVDRDTEVAFKRQQDIEDVPRLLRREKALTRDASFVLLFLRRECAFADPADGPVVVTRDQIAEFLRAFQQEGDLDDARFARRVSAAIQALVKPLQLLTPDPAADYLLTVSPVVVPLVGPDEIQRLEAAFRDGADSAAEALTGDTEADTDSGRNNSNSDSEWVAVDGDDPDWVDAEDDQERGVS